MPTFLTEEWCTAVTDALNGSEDVTEFAEWAELTIQYVATDVPDRDEVRHWRSFTDGRATVDMGEHPDPTATLKFDYETAVAVNKGDLDVAGALAQGKVEMDGEMMALMKYRSEMAVVAEVVGSVPAEY
jgi:hypothetical protein